MGQTAEDITNNIVKITDSDNNFLGTGFFYQQKYCITCHHNIWQTSSIFVERKEKRFQAVWVEKFSDMSKDIAVLEVVGHDFKPLQCSREALPGISVVVRGFPSRELSTFPSGNQVEGKLQISKQSFAWPEENDSGDMIWNKKPVLDVDVYPFDGVGFEVGFSGAPVCYRENWNVVGMFEAKDNFKGYVIPIEEILERFSDTKLKTASPALDTQHILDSANELFDEAKFEQAIDGYNLILRDFNYEAAWYNKGLSLSYLNRHYEALECYSKVIEINPNSADVWLSKGLSHYYLGNQKAAIECYNYVLNLDPKNAKAINNKALSVAQVGNYLAAINYLEDAVKLDPNFTMAWQNKGRYLLQLGKDSEALESFSRAIDLDPKNPENWTFKGYLLERSGKIDDAIVSYEKATQMAPTFDQGWYNLACGYAIKNDEENAIKNLETAINLNPSWKKNAKSEATFDKIRISQKFQRLIDG